MRLFFGSMLVTLIGLLSAYFWGGGKALLLTFTLALLEISLSFDNAILNATILRKMTPLWQQRFLTWGLLIAVFGVRLIVPMLIVSLSAKIPMITVMDLAFHAPENYAKQLANAHTSIAAFGGMFLLLVFLSFLFNQSKEIHWIAFLEKRLHQMGKLNYIEIIIALLVLSIMYVFVSKTQKADVMISGVIGIMVFVTIRSIIEFLESPEKIKKMSGKNPGWIYFIQLELLDASFSLDGIVGAFAITQDIIIILVGLAIGGMFVRSLTVFLIRHRILAQFRYLEHAAHYAIGALSIIMLLSLLMHIPEVLTALIGAGIIAAAMISSLLYKHPF